MNKFLLVLCMLISSLTIRSQSTQTIRNDFLSWRIAEFLQTDCDIAKSINISNMYESWSTEKQFVDNYLRSKDNNLETFWSKDEKSFEILDSLKSVLSSDEYESIQLQIVDGNSYLPAGLVEKYDCNGSGQSLTLKLTKPIVLKNLGIVIVVEKVYFHDNKCWARQITSYIKSDSIWREYLIFFTSNACVKGVLNSG